MKLKHRYKWELFVAKINHKGKKWKLELEFKRERFIAKINHKIEYWRFQKQENKRYKECWKRQISYLNTKLVDENGACHGADRYSPEYSRLSDCKRCPYNVANQKKGD